MGEATLYPVDGQLIIRSVFYFYGDSATSELADQVARDTAAHWNEPQAIVLIKKKEYAVRFDIEGICEPGLAPEKVWYNDNPRLNFFRIEEYVVGNISFVDGLGCNTGYLKIDNLLQTSTTMAHEYGHTLGLHHPPQLDIRGDLEASIMYPRGTICDPRLQYNIAAAAGEDGGTLDPRHRKVTANDIQNLRLHKLDFNARGVALIGAFSSIYHAKQLPGF
ncbi:MAG TPA: peptidase M10 [Flavitalea sp.]|nr:peptidase M10 [Flavitalea sp.]